MSDFVTRIECVPYITLGMTYEEIIRRSLQALVVVNNRIVIKNIRRVRQGNGVIVHKFEILFDRDDAAGPFAHGGSWFASQNMALEHQGWFNISYAVIQENNPRPDVWPFTPSLLPTPLFSLVMRREEDPFGGAANWIPFQ